jgi:hypothetical protein
MHRPAGRPCIALLVQIVLFFCIWQTKYKLVKMEFGIEMVQVIKFMK